MIVIVTGAPASGKTKTCKQLLEKVKQSAWINGDVMLATNPFNRTEQRYLRFENIASLVNNYHESGFKNIFISFVYARQDDLDFQINLFNSKEAVYVIALSPTEEELAKRNKDDKNNRVDIDSSIDINNKIKSLKKIEIIDNSNMSIEEVADKIINFLNFK